MALCTRNSGDSIDATSPAPPCSVVKRGWQLHLLLMVECCQYHQVLGQKSYLSPNRTQCCQHRAQAQSSDVRISDGAKGPVCQSSHCCCCLTPTVLPQHMEQQSSATHQSPIELITSTCVCSLLPPAQLLRIKPDQRSSRLSLTNKPLSSCVTEF